MVTGLHQPLLGRPAIEALKLVARVNAIEEEKKPQDLYPQLFTGLGKLEQAYHIKLKEIIPAIPKLRQPEVPDFESVMT